MMEPDSQVTICITPRERFSCSIDSLEDIVRNTSGPYKLIYIDANSPAAIAGQLASICRTNSFTYLREDHYLAPNQARNIALKQIDTRYVAFLDNDVFVTPGWLDAMLHCARDTGAWAVSPVILEGGAALQVIHMAGGDLVEQQTNGYNRIHQRHRYVLRTLRSVRDQLRRELVSLFEFHCVLLRTDVFDRRDFLDERFTAHAEHLDLAREIRLAHGTIYFEPAAVVRYDTARKFEEYDRAYFELRWGPDWTHNSIEHARNKWHLGPQDSSLKRIAAWTEKHRGLFATSQTSWTLHILPKLLRRRTSHWLREHKLIPEIQAL